MNTSAHIPAGTEIRTDLQALKNLLITDSFLPHSGGSRVYYGQLYQRLTAQFPDTVTILTKKVPGWRAFDDTHSAERYRIRRLFKPLPNWKYKNMPKAAPQFLHAAFHLATERFDCLHCGDLFPQGLNAVFLSKMFHLPFLIYCHGDEVSQTDCRQFQPRVRNYIYERADFVIAANQFAVDRLLRIGIAKNKIAKLTPGVDMKRFFPAPPRQDLIDRYGLQGHKVLLTVARLVPRKGHKVVLEALSNVIKEMPRLKYIIAGEGPEKGNLEQLVQNLGLQEHVIFVGNIPNAEISNYYNLCDVFAMVNRLEIGGDIESFGMVFTEANATGKPVIGGRSGGTDESVIDGETGFLVDPNDPQELSDRLLLLLKNGDLCLRMGTAGLHRVQSQFDWNSRALALRNIVVEVVQRFRTDTRNGQ